MTSLSRKLEQTLSSVIHNSPILPVKVADGILVGNVKIVSDGSLKNLWQHNTLVYSEISLNKVAIKLANLLAKHGVTVVGDKLYRADQEYGRWFIESQMLRSQYQKAMSISNFDRADMLRARYSESRDRAIITKSRAEALSAF